MFSTAFFTRPHCQYLYKRRTFFASNLNSSGRSHVCSLFTDEEQKNKFFSSWRTDKVATHSGLVHNVIDGNDGRKAAVLTFVISQPSNVDEKWSEKLLCVYFPLFLSIRPVMLLRVGNTLKCCSTFPAGSLTERASSFNTLTGCSVFPSGGLTEKASSFNAFAGYSVFPSDGLTEGASSCNTLKLCSIFL